MAVKTPQHAINISLNVFHAFTFWNTSCGKKVCFIEMTWTYFRHLWDTVIDKVITAARETLGNALR